MKQKVFYIEDMTFLKIYREDIGFYSYIPLLYGSTTRGKSLWGSKLYEDMVGERILEIKDVQLGTIRKSYGKIQKRIKSGEIRVIIKNEEVTDKNFISVIMRLESEALPLSRTLDDYQLNSIFFDVSFVDEKGYLYRKSIYDEEIFMEDMKESLCEPSALYIHEVVPFEVLTENTAYLQNVIYHEDAKQEKVSDNEWYVISVGSKPRYFFGYCEAGWDKQHTLILKDSLKNASLFHKEEDALNMMMFLFEVFNLSAGVEKLLFSSPQSNRPIPCFLPRIPL